MTGKLEISDRTELYMTGVVELESEGKSKL